MKSIKVHVGTIQSSPNGVQVQDERRLVEFEGERVATRDGMGSHGGQLSDTRGVTETLFKTKDGRLVVHVSDWSRWQREPTIESLVEVEESDLRPGGRFEFLGAAAGYGRPLTLDEALEADASTV